MKDKELKKNSLLSRWKSQKHDEDSKNGIEKAPEGAVIPLSYGQQQLWFLQQRYPDNPFYNCSERYSLIGKVQVDKLIAAIKAVCSSHDILSSSYHVLEGETIQKINDFEIKIPFIDLSNLNGKEQKKRLDEISFSNATKKFDLAKAPLFSIVLIKINEEEYQVLCTLHHIITDIWSMDVFRKELALHYTNLCLGQNSDFRKSEIQYTDYAYWRKFQELDSSQLAYWKSKLTDAPPFLGMPTDKQRPTETSYQGKLHTRVHSKLLSQEILGLAKKLETTPFVLLLTVYNILLFRYSGQPDVLIGSPISNRNNKTLESLVGFFIDTVVLRNKISGSMTFIDLFNAVRDDVFASFSNKDIPFDFLVKSLKPNRTPNTNPFFQVMFVYHAVTETSSFGPNLKLNHAPVDVGVSKFDLTLYISEDKGVISTTFEYATDLYEESTIERFQEFFEILLKGVLEDKQQEISKIGIATIGEKNHLPKVEVVENSIWARAKGIHHIIEAEVKKDRNKHAVGFKDEYITYGQLNDQANKLAQKILKRTSKSNEIVGLCLPRSIEMMVGVLAILKAGCAYLPLDPEYPQERLNFMLSDTVAAVVVTSSDLLQRFDELQVEKILVNSVVEETSEDNLKLPEVVAEDLAYVIYTSGSTGKPKGVPITHGNIINSTKGRLDFYDENPSSFLLLSSIAFDSAKAGIFWTLCTGGKLIVSEERLEQDIDRIGEIMASNEVSHTLMLPSLYTVILQHSNVELLESLRTVIVAGEACTAQMTKGHFKTLPKVKLYNEYGPTEATVWCIAHQIQAEDLKGVIPIGKAVAGSEIILLDGQRNPVPHGAVGEIYVGGLGLSGQYLNRPELTKEAYVDHPIFDKKLYKTGDLAKLNTQDNLEFLGRVDHQVKIRGHRIELDEIKSAVLDDEMVKDAEVCVAKVNSTDQLFLYLIGSSNFDTQELKKNLAKRLPKHMVPSRYMVMDKFPQLPNGKVDKNALLALPLKQETKGSESSQIESITPAQGKLQKIWKDILQIETIGIHDNFFEIGGDSILSIQIIAKARKMGFDFSPNDLFEHQTIAELGLLILDSKNNAADNNLSFTGPLRLSPIQHWFFDGHKSAPHFWNQAFRITLPENCTKQNVKNATEFLLKQHDALRTVFEEKESSWSARILEQDEPLAFQDYDISGFDDTSKEEKIKTTLKTIQNTTDLSKGPLFRCLFFEGASHEYSRAILLAHHLVVDMVSWQLILDDFTTFISGENKFNTTRTTSIAAWGDYLTKLSGSDKTLEEIDFWKEQVSIPTFLPTDFDKPTPIFEKNVATRLYSLDVENTEVLTSEANRPYSTRTDELLLVAVAETLTTWSNFQTISFAVERHGRETVGTDIDLSNTVGWFTSFFPIAFNLSGDNDYARNIVVVKEKMRNIPNGGIGYGVLRYLTNKLGMIDYPQVVFNFLGNNRGSDFEFLAEGVRHPDSERNYLIEINSFIENDMLVMNWSYSTEHYLDTTIDDLLAKFDSVLKEIIIHCTNENQGKFTPSDFPELGLDQDGLDGLLDSLDL